MISLSLLTPELNLIISCLRQTLNQQEQITLSVDEARLINWLQFSRLLDAHRLVPILYPNLPQLAGLGMPLQIQKSIRTRMLHNAHRAMKQTAELVQVMKYLKNKNIQAFPLKGPVLALQLYGDVSHRHAGDLDIMVFPSMVGQAENILQELGYQRLHPANNLNHRQQQHYKILHHHAAFLHPQRHISLELHWRLLWDRYLLPDATDLFGDEASWLTVGGQLMPCLPPRHLILFLCAHASNHGWGRLFWLYDLAKLYQPVQRINWGELIKLAGEFRCLHHLLLGTALAHNLLHCRFPDVVMEQWEHYPEMVHLFPTVYNFVNNPPSEPLPLRQSLYLFLYLCRMGYSLPQALHLLSYKFVGVEWEELLLPEVLFPLYIFLKPFLLWKRRYRLSRRAPAVL